jgi:outer membrane protein assembly factor BamE (lipoprotein component of BamABCDE complex)
MKTILKILSTAGLIVTLVFSCFLGTAPLFDQIKLGMRKSEVVKLIGEPLNLGEGYDDSLVTNFYYTDDGKLLSRRKPGVQKYDDFAWYRSMVGFDTAETVVYLDKGWSHD